MGKCDTLPEDSVLNFYIMDNEIIVLTTQSIKFYDIETKTMTKTIKYDNTGGWFMVRPHRKSILLSNGDTIITLQ